MEIERTRGDLIVAASAGGATIVLAVVSSVVGTVTIGTFPTLAPLGVYLAYLFSRKGGPYGARDVPRNWAVAAVLVGFVVLTIEVGRVLLGV